MAISHSRAKRLLAAAPGPSPWYLKNAVPDCDSRLGKLTWTQCGNASVLVDAGGRGRLMLGMYVYALPLAKRSLLVWHAPRHRAPAAVLRSTGVQFHAVAVDELDAITDVDQTAQLLEREGLPFVSFTASPETRAPILELPARTDGGSFSFGAPAELSGLAELLFFVHGETTQLWSVRFDTQLVEVMPQDWFDGGDFDFGYQWPTRAARDPNSGAIVGDGIRIGTFALDATNRNLAKWLDRSV